MSTLCFCKVSSLRDSFSANISEFSSREKEVDSKEPEMRKLLKQDHYWLAWMNNTASIVLQ
jgi:hypothetical protein